MGHGIARHCMKPIISPHVRIRHPEQFEVGDYSIVDDFCYFSTRVRIGLCSHIASGCSVAGGAARQFTLGDFCSLSSGVKIWCTSDDFVNDLVTIVPAGGRPDQAALIAGDVTFANCTAVGSNTVVMPRQPRARRDGHRRAELRPAGFAFEPWSVYAGIADPADRRPQPRGGHARRPSCCGRRLEAAERETRMTYRNADSVVAAGDGRRRARDGARRAATATISTTAT